MADSRYLKRRRQGWYFQLAVPSKLRETLGDTIIVSLKTRDKAVAQDRRWDALNKAREKFAELGGIRRSTDTEPVDPHTLLEINDLAHASYKEALAAMQADALRGVRITAEASRDERGQPNAREVEGLNKWSSELWLHGELDNFAPVAKQLAAYCERKAIAVGSDLYKLVGRTLLKAHIAAVEGRRLALKGEIPEQPKTFLTYEPIDPVSLQPLRIARRGGLMFAEVAHRFIAEKQRDPAVKLTEQTRGQYEVAFRLFDQFAKQPKLDDVDRRKASDFLDAIASLDPHWGRGPGVKKLSFAEITERFGGRVRGLSNKTINRYPMALSMVWQFAEDRDGYEGKNPWTGQMRPTSKRRGNSETDKRGFTPVEMKTLLEHAPDVAPKEHDTETALPWLKLISAYSGMRLNEICELDVEDVRETGGILFFDLTTAKTEAGVRVVPVHSQILAAGFRDYVAGIKAGPLWPGLKPGGPDKKKSWYVSKRFTEYRRGLELIDIDKVTGRDRLDFHSLRRSTITALKHAGIPEHDAAEVVGHDHPRVTFGVYPDRQKLSRLQAVVEAIRYDC